jgi:hypothetical protein
MVLRSLYNKALGSCLIFVSVFTAMVFLADQAYAAKETRKTFASPEEAVKAVVDAVKNNNNRELTAIFGPGSQPLVSSGDKVDDSVRRERFLKAYEEKNSIEKQDEGKAILHIGSNDFLFPIPILEKGSRWSFDTKEGKEEILCRRIGRNELNVMDVLHAYTDAQREYASRDPNNDGVKEFAQKLISSKGKKDGLYWEVKEGEKESPFGPLIAKAAKEGYEGKQKNIKLEPFHGYYFRILKAQGKNAEGGAFDYVVKGHMILGFGLVAYPAKYGSSGVMTFIVNQDGAIYQKDLGKNTKKAAAMTKYDPDKTWKKVEEADTQ